MLNIGLQSLYSGPAYFANLLRIEPGQSIPTELVDELTCNLVLGEGDEAIPDVALVPMENV